MTVQQPQLSPKFFAEMQGKALEAFSVLADMNHRVLQGLVGLSAATAKEGLRTYAELQSAAAFETARAPQAPAAVRGGGAEAAADPARARRESAPRDRGRAAPRRPSDRGSRARGRTRGRSSAAAAGRRPARSWVDP